jgi:mRNA-degrading endonuclease HigB of HigAB toxin-antitoxin module
VKVLGQTEAATFLREHPEQAEKLRALLAEMRSRDWTTPEALTADFRSVDTTCLPLAVFRIGKPALVVETLVDFRNGIVLLTDLRTTAALTSPT